MILSFYQSLKTIPQSWVELSKMYQLSPWQKFWFVEVPFAFPGLLWNTMMSLSAGWFFVVASEVVTISHQEFYLPGIGSYIALAAKQQNAWALIYAICMMFAIILIYDQMFFRPANYWIMRVTQTSHSSPPWMMRVLNKSKIFKQILHTKAFSLWFTSWPRHPQRMSKTTRSSLFNHLAYSTWVILIVLSALRIIYYLSQNISFSAFMLTFKLGFYTAVRVFVLILICLIVWVPVGVKIGESSSASAWIQPIIQFLAAFPPPILYPIFSVLIIHYALDPNIWLSPLMILGTQWYILFNVIAGAQAIPIETKSAMDMMNLPSYLRWTKWPLPSIFPYLVTGIITASGGAWNASIEAEQVYWGSQIISADGLGSFIRQSSSSGQIDHLVLGVVMMCLWVFVINQVLWIPLYHMAQKRYRF